MADDLGLVGATLADRYELLERIGRGGMGDVYRALDRELDDAVALKVVRDELLRLPGVAERFRAEVKLARRVTHRNVARTFELGRHGALTFFTMELVDGESLTARLARGPLAGPQAAAIAAELCDALAAAHDVGVIHRDLKPDNVLLARDGRVVLTDFGVAALTAARDASSSGTPRYMAPEQARGEAATPAVDVYALGLVLLEMVTGTAAFEGGLGTVLAAKQDDARALPGLDGIDPVLAAIIARATAPAADARWPSVHALRDALPAPRATVAPRPHVTAGAHEVGLPTVLVVPPRALAEVAHLAHGFHGELVRRLARRSHLRLLRRTHGEVGPRGARIAVEATDHAAIAITLGARAETIAVRLPLDVDALVAGADLTSRVIAAAIGAGPELGQDAPPLPPAARDHLWRGQAGMRAEDGDRARTFGEFAAAQVHAPDDPRVLAALAMCEVRAAFFAAEPRPEQLAVAAAHAATAASRAPHLAEAQVACGHVRLHQGDAPAAAAHFRAAIARAPYLPEAHEWLGRMLLEAGFLADGVARLADALEMDPDREAARWDLARAAALDGRWDDHDAVLVELRARVGPLRGRLGYRMRLAGWRGDMAGIAAVRAELLANPGVGRFEGVLLQAACEVALGAPWAPVRATIVPAIEQLRTGGERRRAFTAQIAAELAGGAGDVDTALRMIEVAIDAGLFDRHWMARCPLLIGVRAAPRFAELAAIVGARADAVLDAVYGDHASRGSADTLLVAPSR